MAGNEAAGLCENGTVYSTLSEDINQPMEDLTDVISIETKNQKIYAVRSDWNLVPIIQKQK